MGSRTAVQQNHAYGIGMSLSENGGLYSNLNECRLGLACSKRATSIAAIRRMRGKGEICLLFDFKDPKPLSV